MRIGRLKTRKQQVAEEKKAYQELVTAQRKVLAGDAVPNFEYNKILSRLRKIRRGNWRTFEVEILAEAQSDWENKELREHIKTILEDSLLRRYSVKVRMTPGKGRRNL